MSKDGTFGKVTLKEEEIIVLSDGHGNEVRCIECNGHYFSARGIMNGRIPDPRTNFPKLRELQLRDDDVFLLAYPKSGTHWLWEILSMLRSGQAEHETRRKVEAMFEFQNAEKLDLLPSPRTINSHLRFPLLPRQLEEKKHKLIFIQRNPKDIAVSYYFHNQIIVDYKGTFSDFVDMFMGDKVYYGAWAKYILHWEEVFRTYPKELLHFVNFEDVKKNPIHEIKRMALFLDLNCEDTLIKHIAEKCDFENLKQANTTVKCGQQDSHMYRKGIVGDWKNWFTVSKNEEFDRFLKQISLSCKSNVFNYTYELK